MAKDKTDSVTHHEDRHAKMREEAAQNERDTQEEAVRQQNRQQPVEITDEQRLAQYAGPISPDDTRDGLLERIRQMRNEKPPVYQPLGYNELQRQRLEEEQRAGREAVARAEEAEKRNRHIREQAEQEERQRTGSMQPVHHPNPSQQEQFPATRATLGKTK